MGDAVITLDTGIRLAEFVGLIGSVGYASVRIGRLSGRFEVLITQQGKEITALQDHMEPLTTTTTAIAVQTVKIAALESGMSDIGKAIVVLAQQDERLINQARRIERAEQMIDDLRRGKGIIQD